MTETHRPDPERVARDIRNKLIEKDRIQKRPLERLLPFEAAGWTIYPSGADTAAGLDLGGREVEAELCEGGFKLKFWGMPHSLIFVDADEAIAYVEAVKQALEG